MANTQHFNIPIPQSSDAANYDANMQIALEMVDTILQERQLNLGETVGIVGEADSEVSPYTMLGIGYNAPEGDSLLGPFTVDNYLDKLFIAIRNFMDGKIQLPISYPEAAYCGVDSVAQGQTLTGVYGPIVRLKNDSTRTSIPHTPVYLSNEGGAVPAELLSTHYPMIFPRDGFMDDLLVATSTYVTNKPRQDWKINFPETTETYSQGQYRSAYFDHDNFVASAALSIVGFAKGVFRVYGLDASGTLVHEDVTFVGASSPETNNTVRTDWTSLVGVSFRAADLPAGTALGAAADCVVTVGIYSLGESTAISNLHAFRPNEGTNNLTGGADDPDTVPEPIYYDDPYSATPYSYMDADTFTNPDVKFRVSWESYDMGFLWDSSQDITGMPFVMFSLGLLDNRYAYMINNLDVIEPAMTDVQKAEWVETNLTTDLLTLPATPKPLYVVGTDKDGLAKTWTVDATTVVDTTVRKGTDTDLFQLTTWGWDDVVADSGNFVDDWVDWCDFKDRLEPSSTLDAHNLNGTAVVFQYKMPTDIGTVTNILWAHTDDITQYSKFYGAVLPIPIGRCLAPKAKGEPLPVKLWTAEIMDNMSKLTALADIASGWIAGNLSGEHLSAQVEAIGAQYGFSEKETHMLLNIAPIMAPIVAWYYWEDGEGEDNYRKAMVISGLVTAWSLSPSLMLIAASMAFVLKNSYSDLFASIFNKKED